ncbi:hypothetical protein [Streptomyces sp. Ru71]|uniref:hypothetical protein n=1 Tax=Streptomyces sp. Ru71 TaxID=2080746 RepID=UPI0011AFF923|nr:hypothetical protein [Streptomyces sp. Ru71]
MTTTTSPSATETRVPSVRLVALRRRDRRVGHRRQVGGPATIGLDLTDPPWTSALLTGGAVLIAATTARRHRTSHQ